MKVIEALKQINTIFSEYVAIAKDEDGNVYAHNKFELEVSKIRGYWYSPTGNHKWIEVSESFASKIEWDSDDWTKCIATLNNIQNES